VSNTIGVDGGATLTVIRALTTNTSTLLSFPITKVGAGQMNVGSSLFDSGTSQFSVSMLVDGPLTVAGGTLRVSQVAPDNDAISRVDNVILAGTPAAPTSKLDLSNTSLIINGGNLSAITALIRAGLENGGAYDWNGNGIASSTAGQRNVLAGSFLYALGVLRNNLDQVGGSGPIYSEFGGLPLSIDEILVKYTYFGDADLSGEIDATDYSLIDNGYVNRLSGWINGDFDYNGIIDATDYALIDNAFINQGLPLGQIQQLLAERRMRFGQAYVSALAAIQSGHIPEPAAATVAVAVVGCVLRPPRRASRRGRIG
jgi:hypothetical protein